MVERLNIVIDIVSDIVSDIVGDKNESTRRKRIPRDAAIHGTSSLHQALDEAHGRGAERFPPISTSEKVERETNVRIGNND